jgi:TPP-dependent pyruvate/acetoin dehydrogenase alpha subunit
MKNNSMHLLHSMLRIRRVEEALADRYVDQEMRCPMHLCIGQEAIAVGVCATLARSDRVYGNHRAHGHYLAKGGSLNSMVAEIYGRVTGCCGGRGGSMHLIDVDAGFMGATPIVGGTVPVAVGSAWKSSLTKDRCVTVVFFGDGCFEEGVLHESMIFSALHSLPIVFVCENNDFSVYTRRNERQPNRPIYRIAEAHGINASSSDGNNIEDVLNVSKDAVEMARNGGGPQFLEFRTYRWREHCGPNFDDELGYRSVEEVEAGLMGCPISRYKDSLGLTEDHVELLAMEERIKLETDAAFAFALSSEKPRPEMAKEKLYA